MFTFRARAPQSKPSGGISVIFCCPRQELEEDGRHEGYLFPFTEIQKQHALLAKTGRKDACLREIRCPSLLSNALSVQLSQPSQSAQVLLSDIAWAQFPAGQGGNSLDSLAVASWCSAP